MKSKAKILNIISLLGLSLLSINGVYSLSACEKADDGKTDKVPTGVKYCIASDGKIKYRDESDSTKLNELSGVEIYGFNTSGAKIEGNDIESLTDANIESIFKCDESSICTQIRDDVIKFEENIFINIYENNGKINHQLIKHQSQNNEAFTNNAAKDSLNIILCDGEKCSREIAAENNVYLNGDKIMKCISSKCSVVSEVTEESYYLNAGDSTNPLISCTNNDKVPSKITCSSSADNNGYYINGISSKSIINCNSQQCDQYTPSLNSYFLNKDGKGDKQLIVCHGGTCSAQSGENNDYYLTLITDDQEKKTYNVISCTTTETADGKRSTTTECKIQALTESKGYYRNADDNTNDTYPLIKCKSTGCSSLKIGQDILPGYYIDITEDSPSILICNDQTCSKDEKSNYSNKINGNYKFDSVNLQFVVDSTENEDDVYSSVASGSDDENALYYYVEINSTKGFPGITQNTTTLFKVSKYYIVRVVTDGIIFVDTTTNKVTDDGTPGSDTVIYTCTKSKKICSIGKTCNPETYLLDVQNSIGYYCSSKKVISKITEDGYYIDSSNGTTKRPLIYCVSGVCKSLTSSNYFVNAGSDKTSNPLIYCNGTTCRTNPGSTGYYLSGVKDSNGNSGIIKCTSSSNCDAISTSSIKKNEHYYLNNGSDKIQKALIRCKNKNCITTLASDGYFITSDGSSLIYCENAISCSSITASAGYYNAAVSSDSGKKIIECTALSSVNCELKDANVGYYVAKTANILINCNVTPCKATTVTNGIYRSATTQVISSKRDFNEDENSQVSNKERATTAVVYNIITCSTTGCNELTTSELASIPVCTFSNNKCFINNRVTISTSTVSAISSGSYCTNSDRSIIYFATDTVVIDPYIIDGTTSIYTYTTTTTNCIEALDKYSSYYYTVGSSIYKISESSIVQIVSTGYYFINVETNTLVNGNSIESYNQENVKLFRCNDSSCSIIDKPDTVTYYADVNKRIIQYNPNSDSYSFAYENDVICIYANNKCTPRADVKSMEFCITYKGELALVTNDIKSRETGECYKADGISSKVYGLSQYMYVMNAFSAERIVDTAYYVISMSTNSTATIRDYDGRNNSVRIYGCIESKCNLINPVEGVYYYDSISRYMFRYTKSKWVSPQAAGYALISTSPNDVYINRFSLKNNRTTIDGKVRTGYYYTIDKEMYECDQDKYQCEKISDNGYYFTVSGEIYQCIYDSEGLEETECIKKNCIVGQYYYLNSKYYYCGSGYILNLVTDKTCEYDDRVIINFPVAFSESYPDKIKNAVESISTVNNSTALVTNINSKYVTSVSGVFTNCTYTVEEKESEFDLVCVNNYVAVNEKTDNVEICSVSQLGYVECVEDENNPEKCNPSGAISRYAKGFTFMFSIIISTILYLFI